MKALLSPFVKDFPTVTFMGLCKNAGKTTALCRLMAELEGERLAVTSVGRDGEGTDLVTGTEKPRIWVNAGTLFATARGMLPLCDATLEVLAVTDVSTPLGQVAVLRALSGGYVQIAGPSAVNQLPPLFDTFRTLGAQHILVDGAAGRKSMAGAEEGGCAILCVGASMEGGLAHMVAETSHTCTLFSAPIPENPALRAALKRETAPFALFTPQGNALPLALDNSGQPLWGALPRDHCVLWVGGAVTSPMVRTLSQRGAPITLAVPDATHFLCDRASTHAFLRRGGQLMAARTLPIAAVCLNPWSARGNHFDPAAALDALRQAVDLPVVNCKEEDA